MKTSPLSTPNAHGPVPDPVTNDESLHWTAMAGLLGNHPDPSFYDDEELCLPEDEQIF